MKKYLPIGVAILFLITSVVFSVLYFKSEKETKDLLSEKANLEQQLESHATVEGYINSLTTCSDEFLKTLHEKSYRLNMYRSDSMYINDIEKGYYLLVKYEDANGTSLCSLNLINYLAKINNIESEGLFTDLVSMTLKNNKVYYSMHSLDSNSALYVYDFSKMENKLLREFDSQIVFIDLNDSAEGLLYFVGLEGVAPCEDEYCGQKDNLGTWFYNFGTDKNERLTIPTWWDE